jgi:hypothetical protein
MFDARIDVARSRNESRHRAPCRADQSSLTIDACETIATRAARGQVMIRPRKYPAPGKFKMPGNEKPQLLKKKASIINEE